MVDFLKTLFTFDQSLSTGSINVEGVEHLILLTPFILAVYIVAYSIKKTKSIPPTT